MHADILPPATTTGSRWAAKILTLMVAAFALLATRAAFAQITPVVGTNLIDISTSAGNETDPSIAINPVNPANMAVVAATDGTTPGIFLSVTSDTGATWTSKIIGVGGDDLAPAFGEASAAFDSYGNLFVAYLPDTYEGVAIAVSTDNGASFSALTNLANFDATDQPRITAPPSGAAAGSVWVAYKDYTTPNTPLLVQGMLSTGLGYFGSFSNAQIVPGSANGGFADIAVGPLGQVMVAFQDNLSGLPNPNAKPPANIWISVETNAVANGIISGKGFAAAKMVATDAIGGLTYIPAASSGIGINAAPGLGWDFNVSGTNYGKVYLIYTAVGPNKNLVVSLLSSSNSGTKWSGESYVNDDAFTGFNDHFLPRLAVDPTTGIIACSWYDCRNDLGVNSVTLPSISDIISNTLYFPQLMVTNVNWNGFRFPYQNWIDLSGGQGNNILITLDMTNVTDTSMAAMTLGDIGGFGFVDIGSTNNNPDLIALMLESPASNMTPALVTVILTNEFPLFYTSRSSTNKEAVMYSTLSFDGGVTFLANQQLISSNQPIAKPAVGIASGIAGSTSTTGWGHYSALAAYGANFFPVWADSSDVATNNPDGANTNFDLYMLGSGGGQSGISAPTADLSVVVSSPSSIPIISGESLTYSVTVINNGPRKAGLVTVTNILSPYVTLLPNGVIPGVGGSYSIQTINGQKAVILTWPSVAVTKPLTSTIRVEAMASTSVTNFASVYSSLYDLVPVNNTNLFVLPVAGQDLAVGMGTSETNVLIGDTVITWVTVTNLGPATNGPVFVTNVFSSDWTGITVLAQGTNLVTGNTAIVNLGYLPVGQPVTAMFTALAISGSTSATQTATVSSQDIDTNLFNNTASISYFVNGEDLSVGFAATNSSIPLQQPVPYVMYVTNLGLSYSGSITVTGTFAANFHLNGAVQSQGASTITGNRAVFNIGVLGAGQIASMSVSATAVSGPAVVTNTLTVSSSNLDPVRTNNTATAVISITASLPISNLVVSAISKSAVISWDTSFPATAQVLYGTTSGYGSFSPAVMTPTNHHIVLLTGLQPTNYSFEVLSWVGSQLYTTNGSFSLATNNLILDTPDARYSGLWTAGSVASGLYGTYYQFATTTDDNPTSWALYDPFLPSSGLYNVYIWHPQNTNFTTNAQVYLTGATNEFILSVDESINGNGWQPLATNMFFTAGTNGSVTVFNNTGDTNKYVVANALMWVYNAAQDAPTNGTVPAWWANAYFGTNANGYASGAADPDGDGYSNYADYVFGTDPNNASSKLSFTVTPVSANTVSVTFSPCQYGRAYELQSATNLASLVWTTLTNGFTASTNGSGTFTVSQTNSGNAFYRLSAQVIP